MTPAAAGRKRPAAAALVSALLWLLAGCGLGDPAPPAPLPPAKPGALHIAVPAYVDPTDAPYWESVIDAAPQLRDVIVNPSNGPGAAVSDEHVRLIGALRDAGVRVLGYVMTGWGGRNPDEVTRDIDRWRDWYGVDDIFLDEAASAPGEIGTYAGYTAGIHRTGGIAVLNPGIIPDRGYFEFADAIVTFEDPFAGYFSSEQPPEWLQTQSRTEVWHIISGAPEGRLGDVLDRARQQGAGKIFVTDDEEPNPYDSLPTYWSAKQDSVDG
ncbi:hypothetical protein QFZ70_000892 [Arthrobacter sp. V1I9]|uniref:spherulation-specific family 4 protein n=1 Tax=Arthrobacter sp. V1I9 TaxID=3042275 RepID=UPI0027923A18|nr:spherulation-specific family 4 protein [Arthrobacter sp. V1I9]MDQ0868419.1 hypothetical protein [Arthrobacter sp. V1I9]